MDAGSTLCALLRRSPRLDSAMEACSGAHSFGCKAHRSNLLRLSHPRSRCSHNAAPSGWAGRLPAAELPWSSLSMRLARPLVRGAQVAAAKQRAGAQDTVLPFPIFFPEPWLTSLRLTTTRPARPPQAGAESRSFERCAPTTSCRDPTPASTTPLPAHGPCTARICTSATAMRTRCGEGDLVGGWHAGASPFTPITRWVTNRGSSSASFAHAYTPLGRSQRL